MVNLLWMFDRLERMESVSDVSLKRKAKRCFMNVMCCSITTIKTGLINQWERRPLSDLLDLWWAYHGKNHPYGEIERVRIRAVINDMKSINITRSDQLTRKGIINYRLLMLNKGIKQSTVNRYCAMMSGFFTKLINVEEYSGKNPFHEVKRLKAEQTEMAYLSQDEITRLLGLLSGDDLKAVMVCLATGGRWSEVTGLKGEHVIGGKVVFMKTKNGKRRAVPIDAELEKTIKVRTTGLLMKPSYTTVRSALKEVKPDLHGQAVHVLRHTFATHFMINGVISSRCNGF